MHIQIRTPDDDERQQQQRASTEPGRMKTSWGPSVANGVGDARRCLDAIDTGMELIP